MALGAGALLPGAVPGQAPVPDTADVPGSGRTADGRPASPFRVEELAPGVLAAVLRDDVASYAFANSLVVIGEDGVLVVDTQQSPGAAADVLAAIRRRTDRPVRWVVNTHAHADHYWGNQVYRDAFPDVRIIAHAHARDSMAATSGRVRSEQRDGARASADRVRAALEAETDPDRATRLRVALGVRERYAAELDSLRVVLPDETVGEPVSLDLGGRTARLLPMGPAHTPGDLAVWLPEAGILAAGDLVEDGRPWLDGADLPGWAAALTALVDLEPRIVLPGHGEPEAGTERETRLLTLLRALVDDPRPGARVAATPRFVFYSDARVNLHDFLLWRTAADTTVEPATGCRTALPPEQREAFDRATRLYQTRYSDRDRDRVRLALRFHLVGSENEIVPRSEQQPALDALDAALPAYRACWWETHDRRNRAWVNDLLQRLARHGDAMEARLARDFRSTWRWPIPVDVATWAGGANTVLRPHHIMITAVDSAYSGDGALEMIFHEAAHTIAGRSGAVAEAIRTAERELGVAAPRGLWHVLLFHTVGEAARDVLAAAGREYVPYMSREGLWDRAWPELAEPVERYWGAYLRGETGMETAVLRVLEAVAAPAR